MLLLSVESIILKTKLKEDEVIHRLSDFIEPERILRFAFWKSIPSKLYEGEINGKVFDIKRIINHRKIIQPRIKGEIQPAIDGTIITIKMQINTIDIALIICCFGCSVLNYFSIPFRLPPTQPAILFVFFAIVIGCFKYESMISKNDLRALFEAQIIDN